MRHRVRDGDELAVERADHAALAVVHGDELGATDHPRLLDAVAGQAERQRRPVDRERDVAQQEGEAAGVVLVRVGEEHGLDPVGVLAQVGEVGEDEVDAGHVDLGEHDPAVDDEDAVLDLEAEAVPADLTEPAEEDDLDRRRAHTGSDLIALRLAVPYDASGSTVWEGGMRARSRVMGLVSAWSLAFAVASVGVAVPAGASAPAGSSAATWSLSDIKTARALIADVPEAIRPSCAMNDLHAPGGDGRVVASIRCSVPSGDGNYTLDYVQYESADAMQSVYDDVVAAPLEVPRPDGCTEDNGYTVDDEHAGSYVCVPGEYSNSIIYTYEPLQVVATLTDYFDDGIESDAASLSTYWNDHAGPNADAGTVPRLLTNKQGLAAYQALRAKIPAAIRPKCKPNRNSFTNPYVAAQVECEHPSPGVWLARLHVVPGRRGHELRPTTRTASSPSARTRSPGAPCPASGTWKVKGAVRGRYACTVDTDNSYLLWTLNKARIVVYAYAEVGDMDTADFIDWWNNEAGPNLN